MRFGSDWVWCAFGAVLDLFIAVCAALLAILIFYPVTLAAAACKIAARHFQARKISPVRSVKLS